MKDPIDSLFKYGKDAFLHRLVPIPRHMLAPRVGVANIEGMGLTVVVADELSTPLCWNPESRQWVELEV